MMYDQRYMQRQSLMLFCEISQSYARIEKMEL